jgi:LmbE family N-acetylglucosaminyl deacetylase
MRRIIFFFFSLLLTAIASAQSPMPPQSAAELQHRLKRLQVLGSVLYLAAHPDDENQRLIATFAKGNGYRTTYLSLTRGDGGQNLIGDEKGELLGMLRTQELLQARRIDGGEQTFSRAYDFGYSKTPEETLEIWDKQKVLADVVWAIRKYRPDVIVTRFATPEDGGGGHGHHTASAMLAHEAFDLAGDPTAFPEQLDYVEAWQPRRLFWNNYWVFRNYEPTEEDLKGIITLDVGQYDPLLGESYGEIASRARSMHKCQAFGTRLLHGSQIEYLDLEKGEPLVEKDPFDGIETSWSRINQPKVGKLLQKAYTQFDPLNPTAVLPTLLQAYRLLEPLDGYWVALKREELAEAIAYAAGLWVELDSDEPTVAQGDSLTLEAHSLKRSTYPVTLRSIDFGFPGATMTINRNMPLNGQVDTLKQRFRVTGMPVSQPYWLRAERAKGVFTVADQQMIGLPENPPALEGTFTFDIGGTTVPIRRPVVHQYVDRSIGELYRPTLITPPVTVNVADGVYLFADQSPQTVNLLVKSFAQSAEATLTFDLPAGWRVEPASVPLSFDAPGQEKALAVSVTPPAEQSVGTLRVLLTVEGETYSHSQQPINYDHIPAQLVFDPAEAKLVRVALQKKGQLIGYLMGSGDEIPKSLKQIGYDVELLGEDQITSDNLAKYDAVIAGIRAYNTVERIAFLQDQILGYVKGGGTYLMQYNTTYGLMSDQIGPFDLTLSRDRVTKEDAEMTFLQPDHPVLNVPNQLTAQDFEGWIQERGLYFPKEWDAAYTPIFSAHDPEEDPLTGSLLVAQYGKGNIIYTGLSFFRELPAGVPGAYRLFANLLSLGK